MLRRWCLAGVRQSSCKRANDSFRLVPGSLLDSQFLPHFARGWQPAVGFQTASCPKEISLGWQKRGRCHKKKSFPFLLSKQPFLAFGLKKGQMGHPDTWQQCPESGSDPWQKRLEQRAWLCTIDAFPSAIQLCPAPPAAGANQRVGISSPCRGPLCTGACPPATISGTQVATSFQLRARGTWFSVLRSRGATVPFALSQMAPA